MAVVVIVVVIVIAIRTMRMAALLLLLHLRLLHCAHAGHLLLLDVLDELGHRHAGPLGVLSNFALNLLDLLRRGLLAGAGHEARHGAVRRGGRRRCHGIMLVFVFSLVTMKWERGTR